MSTPSKPGSSPAKPIKKGEKLPLKSAIVIAALGIVFGDIGTSPLYALRECFSGTHAIAVTQPNVLGAVSLVIWFLIIIVTVKYAIFVMRADNNGEGGILSIMALANRYGSAFKTLLRAAPVLGIIGAALLFSDGVITPSISVMSAIEGLDVATPLFRPYVVPLALIVLTALFAIQSKGTDKIGSLFGPVMLFWFATIGVVGLYSLIKYPAILEALNPYYAVSLLAKLGWKSFGLLGSAFLCVTGAEVLYADMGHFGKSPIRTSWFYIVLPALFLNYMGQGACLIHTGKPDNLFYQLTPEWTLFPLVIIATLATVIASQAVISGTFSIARQAVQLGFWPRMKIVHTSESKIGQVYSPYANVALFVVTVLLILTFKESGKLAAAYGIAVSATMFITTLFIIMLGNRVLRLPKILSILFGLFFLLFDAMLFFANLTKFLAGGWIAVTIAITISVVMLTWIAGRAILRNNVANRSIPIDQFVDDIPVSRPPRIQKTAVYLSGNSTNIPVTLLHNFKHNGILHAQTLIVSIITDETPYVPSNDRTELTEFGEGFFKIIIHYGFMESPDVPKILTSLDIPGVPKDVFQLSFFLGKESLVLTRKKTMARWRKMLFIFLTRNSQDATGFFKLPSNRVVEIGMKIEF